MQKLQYDYNILLQEKTFESFSIPHAPSPSLKKDSKTSLPQENAFGKI